MADHLTSGNKYNQTTIIDTCGEKFTAEITDSGVYLDHNYSEGCLYLSHEEWEDLDEFRKEFLEEINESVDQ